jgi:iron complex transport system permease protein
MKLNCFFNKGKDKNPSPCFIGLDTRYFIYFGLLSFLFLSSFLSIRYGGVAGLEDINSANLIMWELRYPRLLASIFSGAALSLAGYVFQSVLKNPLTDPYILGVSSGGALGVGIFLIFTPIYSILGLQLSSIIGALLALGLLLIISRRITSSVSIILIGIGLSLLLSSITTILMSYMEGGKLVYMNHWLIGSVSQAELTELYVFGSVLLFLSASIFILSNSLDVLKFGEDFSISTGLNPKFYTLLFLLLASILTASSVAVCGVIGFVGLVVPHMARLLIKERSFIMIPVVMVLGAGFLTFCNFVAGVLSFNIDVPIGAVSSFIGAPILIYLIFRRYRARA